MLLCKNGVLGRRCIWEYSQILKLRSVSPVVSVITWLLVEILFTYHCGNCRKGYVPQDSCKDNGKFCHRIQQRRPSDYTHDWPLMPAGDGSEYVEYITRSPHNLLLLWFAFVRFVKYDNETPWTRSYWSKIKQQSRVFITRDCMESSFAPVTIQLSRIFPRYCPNGSWLYTFTQLLL